MNISGKRWVLLLFPIAVMVLSLAYSLVMMVRVPVIVDLIEVDPVNWSMERPVEETEFYEEVINVYSTDSSFLSFSLLIWEYWKGNVRFFKGNDGFVIAVNATGSMNDGFVHSTDINFTVEDENAYFRIDQGRSLHNFVFQEIGYHKPVSYVRVLGVGESYCSMVAQGFWTFKDQHNMNHQITIVMDAVWFNGTAYLRTVLPIQLEVTIT